MGTPVQKDNAPRVRHLDEHHHLVRRLEQVNVVVVRVRDNREAGREQTAVPHGEVVPRIGAVFTEIRAPRLRPLLRRRRQRRHASVRRIHDQRRSHAADRVGPLVQPVVVVATDISLPWATDSPNRQRLGTDSTGSVRTAVSFDSLLFEVRRFLSGQKLFVRQFLGPLQGRNRTEIPNALQVRVPPCRPGRRCGVRGLALRILAS